MAERFVVIGDGDEGYRFRIEAEDGQLMATSEPYTSKSSALKGVEAIKRNAAVAQIDDDPATTRTPRPRPGRPPRTPNADWAASSLLSAADSPSARVLSGTFRG